uniref:Uncharacterized protein n=1 Tax=uncultured prokaryote TaxID=198431 RepID=A0A0H5Q0W2_9ZZZZ|nr:hypothetical protein [uncultured prokaryote]
MLGSLILAPGDHDPGGWQAAPGHFHWAQTHPS